MMQGLCHQMYTSSQTLSVGDKWWETGHTRKPQASKGHTTNFQTLDPQPVGQQAACDTLPHEWLFIVCHIINVLSIIAVLIYL